MPGHGRVLVPISEESLTCLNCFGILKNDVELKFTFLGCFSNNCQAVCFIHFLVNGKPIFSIDSSGTYELTYNP